MDLATYESQFQRLVLALKEARDAYDVATDEHKQRSFEKAQAIKHDLLSLSRHFNQTRPKGTRQHPVPANEHQRLSTLRHLAILDSPFESMFKDITDLACHLCAMPISIITLIDDERQWFKSVTGLEGLTETPREFSICTHTIMTDAVMEVEDATLDHRFAGNPFVQGEPNIRFYAGAPITMPLGENIGTLCVIDNKAGTISDYQKIALAGLARLIAHALLLRKLTLERNTIA